MQDGRRAPPATRGMEVGRALTRLPPDPHVRPRARSGPRQSRAGGGTMELHILLVGDEADHADAMRRALVRMEAGVRVTTAARLERALEALRDPAIRCVVTDVRLPDADGVRVLQALRSARRELPVIVVTANGSEELAVAAMKLGAADYVSRHARYTEELPVLVREALGRSVLSAVHEACLDGGVPALAGPDAAAFVATTANMRAVLGLVERAAPRARADRRGHQPLARGRGGGGALPPRPLLPPRRVPHPRPAAQAPHGRRAGARGALPRPLRGARAPRDGRLRRRRATRAPGLPLAGQRARARQRGAPPGAVRRPGRAHPPPPPGRPHPRRRPGRPRRAARPHPRPGRARAHPPAPPARAYQERRRAQPRHHARSPLRQAPPPGHGERGRVTRVGRVPAPLAGLATRRRGRRAAWATCRTAGGPRACAPRQPARRARAPRGRSFPAWRCDPNRYSRLARPGKRYPCARSRRAWSPPRPGRARDRRGARAGRPGLRCGSARRRAPGPRSRPLHRRAGHPSRRADR